MGRGHRYAGGMGAWLVSDLVNCTVTSNSASGGIGGRMVSSYNQRFNQLRMFQPVAVEAASTPRREQAALTISNSIVALNSMHRRIANDIAGPCPRPAHTT